MKDVYKPTDKNPTHYVYMYTCCWNGKQVDVRANTEQRAQIEAARLMKVKRVWEVKVVGKT